MKPMGSRWGADGFLLCGNFGNARGRYQDGLGVLPHAPLVGKRAKTTIWGHDQFPSASLIWTSVSGIWTKEFANIKNPTPTFTNSAGGSIQIRLKNLASLTNDAFLYLGVVFCDLSWHSSCLVKITLTSHDNYKRIFTYILQWGKWGKSCIMLP